MVNYGSRYEKKDTPYGVFFLLLAILLVFGYFVGGLYTLSGVTIDNIGDNLVSIITHPLQHWWNDKTPAMLGLAFCVWFFFVGWYTYYYRNYHSALEHGDARWLEAAAATAELADEDDGYNRILSENVRVSIRGVLSNNNMLVIGSSGSFKTTSILHQNLLQFLCSYVVLDVKGDTQRKLGKAFLRAGYAIRSLNFKSPEFSDRYNPFVYIEKEADMLRVIKALHDAARPKKDASCADPFWDDAVDLYFSALFYYAWLDGRETGLTGTMNDVIRLCNLETQTAEDPFTGEETTKLQLLMNEKEAIYGPDYPPVRDYRKLKGGAPDTVRSVILMINSMISICETAEVKRIFEDNDIDIRELGTGVGGDPKKKVALFLVIPDNNNVYNWIVSMFYTQMFDILIRLADDELKEPLPVPVEVHMDEFYAGAKPADADVLLGVVRSRNISMIPYLQSVAQIKTLFRDDKWETIMDNVASVVYLGSGPAASSTHEFISKLLAEATADSRTDNIHLGSHGNSGLNFARTGIKLMSPDQVKRMPTTDCIIFLESRPPIYDTKAIPFDMPRRGFTANAKLKGRYAKATSLGAYEHPVLTVYDPVHFRYTTIKQQRLQVVTDPDDIRTLQSAAESDPNIYQFDIDENELLYLSWGAEGKSREETEKLYREAIAAEKQQLEDLRGLFVLQDVPGVPESGTQDGTDKSKWNENSLKELLANHWEELSQPEREEICIGIDDGLTEEQICQLVLLPLEEMAVRRRAYAMQRKAGQ